MSDAKPRYVRRRSLARLRYSTSFLTFLANEATRLSTTSAGIFNSLLSGNTFETIESGGGGPAVAPSVTTQVSVSVTATSYETETYTFVPPTFSGSPTPTVTRVLTLAGVDVTSAMIGNNYSAPKSETVRRSLVMTYTASNGTSPNATSTVTVSVPKAVYVVAWFGQSNVDYGANNGPTYTNATILGNIGLTVENMTFIGVDNSDSSGTLKEYPVNPTTVAARRINPAIVQAAHWLNFVAPGKKFVVIDAAESGTTRKQLYDDGDPGRLWPPFENAVIMAENNHGPVNLLLEWWYTGVESDIRNMINAYMPFYTRQYPDGSVFPVSEFYGSNNVDHFLWDLNAPMFEKGEGLFTQGHTKYTFVRNHHKDSSLESAEGISDFHDRLTVEGITEPQGVWGGHYANNSSHALTNDPDGQIQLQWPFAISMARLAGVTIHEPEYVGHEVASDGSYCDVFVSLPNGGTLSTTRIVEARAAASSPKSFMQPVMTMEIERFGSGVNRSPIHALGATTFDQIVNYPEELPGGGADVAGIAANADMRTVRADRRGTVTVVAPGFETHPTLGRVGRIRITPEVAFANGDRIVPQHLYSLNPYAQTYDEGAGLTQKYWLDFPVERVEALRDPSAFYKLPGIPVKPFGPIQNITTVAGAPFVFTPRSVVTTSGSRAQNPLTGGALFAGTEGTLSLWFRCVDAAWPTTARTLLQARAGNNGDPIMALTTASNGRITVVLSGAGPLAAVSGDFNATDQQWNHLAVSWRAGPSGWGAMYSRNGGVPRESVSSPTFLESALRIRTDGIIGLGIGSQSGGGSNWPGELGHVYINLNEALDLRVPSERAKFFAGGVRSGGPASFGQFGQLLTGNAPAFYFDGVGAGWNNVAIGGLSLASLGTLTAGTAPA